MARQEELRDKFINAINHLLSIDASIRAHTAGRGHPFTFADHHKLAEGIFMSAWTDWEEFIRALLLADVALIADTSLTGEIRNFRTLNARWRLAELIINHPDSPERFVEWDYDIARARADKFLPPGHRFVSLGNMDQIRKMKIIRNAVAHGSDKAWDSFKKMLRGQPFNYQPMELRFQTVGRFLSSRQWSGNWALNTSLSGLSTAAQQLVP